MDYYALPTPGDGRLSWLGWLTHIGQFKHKMVTCQSQIGRSRSGKVCWPQTDLLATELRLQPKQDGLPKHLLLEVLVHRSRLRHGKGSQCVAVEAVDVRTAKANHETLRKKSQRHGDETPIASDIVYWAQNIQGGPQKLATTKLSKKLYQIVLKAADEIRFIRRIKVSMKHYTLVLNIPCVTYFVKSTTMP